MPTKELLKYKAENNFKDFYDKIKTLVPELERFMVASLKVSENQGKIDRQFYNAQGMLDEVYLEVFETFSEEMDLEVLKRRLFEKSVEKIDELVELEKEFSTEIHADDILKHELKRLQEKWFVDIDGDLLLKTELDDISYKQDHKWSPEIVLDDDLEKQLIDSLNLDEALLLSEEKRSWMGSIYGAIPLKSRHILELFVFGEQTAGEIASILSVEKDKVDRILKIINEKFRLL